MQQEKKKPGLLQGTGHYEMTNSLTLKTSSTLYESL